MKKVLITVLFFMIYQLGFAQFGLLDRAKQNAKNKVNNKIDEKINKGINKTVDGADNEIKGKNKKTEGNTNSQQENVDETPPPSSSSKKRSETSFKSYSKFDFVPGEKLVAAEDFNQDAIGDFSRQMEHQWK